MLCYQLHRFNVCVSMRTDTYTCRHTRVCKHVHAVASVGVRETAWRSWFCPTTGILGMELRLSGRMVSVATSWPTPTGCLHGSEAATVNRLHFQNKITDNMQAAWFIIKAKNLPVSKTPMNREWTPRLSRTLCTALDCATEIEKDLHGTKLFSGWSKKRHHERSAVSRWLKMILFWTLWSQDGWSLSEKGLWYMTKVFRGKTSLAQKLILISGPLCPAPQASWTHY